MMKRRFVWIGLIACICLLAGQLTLNATGVTAKLDPAKGNQSEKVLPNAKEATDLTSKVATGTLKDSGTRALKTSKAEAGMLASTSTAPGKGPRVLANKSAEKPLSTRFRASAKTLGVETAEIGATAPRHQNTLDDQCDLLNWYGTSASLYSGWYNIDLLEVATFYNAMNCPTNPGYPFKIDSVEVGFHDAGATSGTLTYQVLVRCPSAGEDSCSGPGNIICESAIQSYTADGTGFNFFMVPMDCCVGQPFFCSVRYLTWDGNPALAPSVIWVNDVDIELCGQFWEYGGVWYDHFDIFGGNWAWIDVFGNTNDACTPIPCAEVTGACCNHLTGACVDGVLADQCTGLTEEFFPNETCATLDPQCSSCTPPANDDCMTSAPALTIGQQYCQAMECAFANCEDDIPAVWHTFTLTQCANVTISYCGSSGSPNAYINIFDDCLCNGGAIAYSYSGAGDCGDGNYYVTFSEVQAGTYYIAVPPDLAPNYCITVTTEGCIPCEPEEVLNVSCTPQTVTATTIGEEADCNDDIPTYVYELNITEAGLYNFSLCNTPVSWDSYIWISDECCGAEICAGDDECGVTYGLSAISACDLGVGTYYLHIQGYGTTDEGDFTLDISCCEVECTNNEGEPICADDYVDATNGGCNSDPAVWMDITCGAEICGHAGNFYDTVEETDSRDTDWYRLILTQDTLITWKVFAQFNAALYILTPGPAGYECDFDSIGTVIGGTAALCDTAVISACLTPGEYWFFIAPATFDQATECGTPYYFYLTCEACPPCVADYSISVDCEGYTGTGNTTDAGDDCEFTGTTQDGTTHLDEIWAIEILEAGDYRFSLCNTDPSWDTYMFLTTDCCGGTYLNDYETTDDGCGVGGGPSETACITLEPGTVYLMVEGWSETDFGAYTLDITCCDPCLFTCTDTEGEGACYDGYDDVFNAGCNMWPVTPVASQNFNNAGPWPQSVCGSSGTHLDSGDNPVRDTDWYEFNLTDTALVTLTGIGNFPLTILIVQDSSAAQACSSVVIDSDVADPCSTATVEVCLRPGRYFAWASVSSGLDADCGTSVYELTLDVVIDGCVLLPPAPEVCPEEFTMYGQLFNGSSAGTSEINVQGTEYKRFESFEGCLEPICDVHWWGIEQVYDGGWEVCHEIFMDFVITFHADSSGYPQGAPVCSYTRTVAGAPTTRLFNGDPVYYYETILNIDPDICCSLESGWVSIQGAGSPDCWFLWHTSIDGDFLSPFAADGVWQDDYPNDLAFCLTQAPPPCDPAENLTVYLTTGLGNPHLRWFAPIAEDWNVYRSTDPNNSGDITDPSYVYQTTITGSGDLEWIDPAAFAGGSTYVNYIVVPSCYEPEIPAR